MALHIWKQRYLDQQRSEKYFNFFKETWENKYILLITKENTSFLLYPKFKFHITLLTEAKYYALEYTYRIRYVLC